MNRKYPLFVFALITFLPLTLFAQSLQGDQELSLSYGRKSGTEILKNFHDNPPTRDRGQFNSKVSTTGNYFITYRKAFTDKFLLGLTAGSESFAYDKYYNENPYKTFIAHYNVNITTVAVESKVIYYNGKKLRLYGFAGLGARLYSEKSTPAQSFDGIGGKVFFNTQATPLGISFGKKLSGFLEVGLGYKGLINAGVTYRICRKSHVKEIEEK